jgi:hypothetical protein
MGMGTARPADVVAFHHAALNSTAPSNFELALQKGSLPPFAGHTPQAVHPHPQHSEATIKSNLDQICKNLRSTKKKPKESPILPFSDTNDVDNWFPASEPSNKWSHHWCV